MCFWAGESGLGERRGADKVHHKACIRFVVVIMILFADPHHFFLCI
jgi:hypothetical protein